jgi:DNA primase
MAIVDEDIQRVREATDTVAIVSQYVSPLRRVGRRHVGLCPFHQEKTGSFSVNAEEGLYYCFGCQASGDIIGFVQRLEGLDFPAAVELLAERAGIHLRYTDQGHGERRQRQHRLLEVVEEAAAWYTDRLLTGEDAGAARSYLRSRGFDGDLVRRYRLGWAPEGWDELTRALGKRSADLLTDAGLAFRNRTGRLTDHFRGRVLFPICDVQGRTVGFGGRILPGEQGPKYKNSPDSQIFAKSRLLYELHEAKTAAVQTERVVVCEGYTDVVAFHRAGVGEAVATCGTALTEDHVRLLTRFARHFVLAFDADAAGQAAAARVHEWEEAHGLEVSVAALPEGRDPADLYAEDPAALAKAVDEATPFLGWRLERALRAGRYDTPEQRARTAEAALAVVADHPNEMVRDQYVLQVAERCRIDAVHLRDRLRGRGQVRPVHVAPPARDGEAPKDYDDQELEALRVLAQQRDAIAGRLHRHLFTHPIVDRAYRALAEVGDPAAAADALGDDPAADLVRRVTVEETEAEADEVVWRLVLEAGRRALRRLHEQASEDPDWLPLYHWVRLRLDEIAFDDTRTPAALASLEEWLADQERAA